MQNPKPKGKMDKFGYRKFYFYTKDNINNVEDK